MNEIAEIRPSPIAGTWYPGSPSKLAQQIDSFLTEAVLPRQQGEVVGVIAPHAGHRYSGKTAGHAFACIAGQERDLVVVVSPMHAMHPASLLTTAHRAYGTPLGSIRVDEEAVKQVNSLLSEHDLALQPVANDHEHSLEIELPFLQRALRGDFRLLPIMVRSQSPAMARILGESLARVLLNRKGLLVASTDLAHFYPETVTQTLDAEMLEQMRRFDPSGMFAAERSGKGYACGVGAAAAVLWAARGLAADRVEILHHSTSADETGDFSSVVGYGAAVILKSA